MLNIYNSMSRSKEKFEPIEAGKVRMYVCGITVYDYLHIGHARMLVVFDVIARYLRASGFELTYVRNITDIDDKIIKRAAENGEPIDALTARFIAAMDEDCAAMSVLKPDIEPRATETIDEIVAMIAKLIEKGLAYPASNGDVYYSVAAFEGYGKLSGKQLADLRAGARVEVDAAKRDPLDFVLWKHSRDDEPSWPSPWGAGRPGWHIECSAMSVSLLGDHFDIHGGGMDLQFPHHENEIAQSCGATGAPFVNFWIHNGFVRVDEEKMSKSLGNFFTVREVLKKFAPEVVRYFFVSSQYRSPLNYSEDNLVQARNALSRLYLALRGLPGDLAEPDPGYKTRFIKAMDDDFNTPEALSVLKDMAGEINQARARGDEGRAAELAGGLRSLASLLGLLGEDADVFLKQHGRTEEGEGLADDEVDRLVAKRNAARAARNWSESDRLRDQLAEAGIILEDGSGGTTWRRSE
ncbi:MAG: cysteine--tRNA ligase [Gammaproteobacteria bacterium]|nr:cysteine--tRNA ligase [Gammaproteobacteria bacterium]